METPEYVMQLLKPAAKKSGERKVWSVGLQTVWIPFFTATNVEGVTSVPREALGAPLRLAKDKDGSVKFSKSGKPILRVAPELGDHIRIVRENFVTGLIDHAAAVIKDNPEGYEVEVNACREAGVPINETAKEDIQDAVNRILEAAKAKKTSKREKVAVGSAS
jgi:hypothetical protein